LLQTLKNLHICSIEEAAAVADVVIIATPPAHVREVAYWLGDVRRKVIIDISANAITPGDEYIKTACAIKAITGSAHVVMMFSAKGYENVLTPVLKKEVDLVVAGDSKKAKQVARILADELGMSRSFDLGDNAAIPLFDELTRAWRNTSPAQTAVHAQFSLPRA
jgi:predicted dinucleotide-binding enzyme